MQDFEKGGQELQKIYDEQRSELKLAPTKIWSDFLPKIR